MYAIFYLYFCENILKIYGGRLIDEISCNLAE